MSGSQSNYNRPGDTLWTIVVVLGLLAFACLGLVLAGKKAGIGPFAPTPTPTSTPTSTPTPGPTSTPTRTPQPTRTPIPTMVPLPVGELPTVPELEVGKVLYFGVCQSLTGYTADVEVGRVCLVVKYPPEGSLTEKDATKLTGLIYESLVMYGGWAYFIGVEPDGDQAFITLRFRLIEGGNLDNQEAGGTYDLPDWALGK